MYVCVCVRACVRTCVRACVRACVSLYIYIWEGSVVHICYLEGLTVGRVCVCERERGGGGEGGDLIPGHLLTFSAPLSDGHLEK